MMLWNACAEKTKLALGNGDLLPLTSNDIIYQQEGVNYIVNLLTDNMKIKHSPAVSAQDPFIAPYTHCDYIKDMDTDYVCLLNRFPIVVPHLLICAKDYIPQTSVLTFADFNAWVKGITRSDVLGFFNSGHIAGSSQMHRHMQLVRTSIPLESQIVNGQLPFKHAVFLYKGLNPNQLYADYLDAMESLQLNTTKLVNGLSECLPYNILLTERWMLIIPRVKNQVETLSGHGVNFSGRFLVSSEQQLAWLENYGFMRFLIDCGFEEK